MNKDVTIPVAKESYELGQGIRQFLLEVRKALADGWQPGRDIPIVLQAAFSDLVPQIQDAEKIGLEPSQDLKSFVRALSLCGEDIAFDFVGLPVVKV